MATGEIHARHVFHAPTSGWDRVEAWRAATGEPVFAWGRGCGGVDAALFGPVKRAFSDWTGAHPGAALTVYHDGAGADALGPLDAAPCKVLFPHQWPPRWERNLEWQLRCTGKIITSDAEFPLLLRDRFAWIPERFIQVVPPPAPGSLPPPSRHPPRRTGIWLHGKDWRRHGNRLRSFADHWQADCGGLEFVVSGPARPPAWARKDGLDWRRGLSPGEALQRTGEWDSVLLLDDYTLDAPWLLRALALGCFPLVPDGGGPARTAAWRADGAPAPYPWGDAAKAIALLAQWRAAGPAVHGDFDRWRATVAGAPGTGFSAAWQQALGTLAAQRPVRLRPRRPVSPLYPVFWYERVQRLRQGY